VTISPGQTLRSSGDSRTHDRYRSQADRILIAQLTGEARHHARWHALTEAEHAAAVAALRELAAGRADLLAEVADYPRGHE